MEKIMAKNATKWGEKIKVYGISLDESPKDAILTCKQNGWKLIDQFHIGGSLDLPIE
jgi:hypothetical protein